MCSKRVLTSFGCAVLSLLLLTACNRPCNGPGSEEMKYVSPPAQMHYFVPDSEIFTLEYKNLSPIAATASLSKAAAIAAKINPDKIMVMTVFSELGASQPSQDVNAYDSSFWMSHNNMKKIWDNQVAFFQGRPGNSLVYVGELQRDGNYATGTVGVVKGSNLVLIGFIMPGDTLSLLGEASYYWGYSNYDPYSRQTFTIADGWYGATSSTPLDTLQADSLYGEPLY